MSRRFMVRETSAIKTHVFCSIRAFVKLELMRAENLITNWYEVQRNLYCENYCQRGSNQVGWNHQGTNANAVSP